MKNIDDIPSVVEEDVWLRSEQEREQLMYSLTSRILDKMIVFEFNNEARRSIEEDGVLNYAKQLLSIGCFYLEFVDAIKEGDGERVIQC